MRRQPTGQGDQVQVTPAQGMVTSSGQLHQPAPSMLQVLRGVGFVKPVDGTGGFCRGALYPVQVGIAGLHGGVVQVQPVVVQVTNPGTGTEGLLQVLLDHRTKRVQVQVPGRGTQLLRLGRHIGRTVVRRQEEHIAVAAHTLVQGFEQTGQVAVQPQVHVLQLQRHRTHAVAQFVGG